MTKGLLAAQLALRKGLLSAEARALEERSAENATRLLGAVSA